MDSINSQNDFSVNFILFSQARPYWILKSNPVKMLEWTCYT